MPGQWEQRQFLVRCPNNSAPRFHIYLPVRGGKKQQGLSGEEHRLEQASFSFQPRLTSMACVHVCCFCLGIGPLSTAAPTHPLHHVALRASHPRRHQKKLPLKLWVRGPMWRRRNSGGAGLLFGLWSVYGKGQSAPALTCFSLRKELPLSPPFFFFCTTTDRKCLTLHWSLPPPPSFCVYLCVHAGRRCHTAITALNDHVGLDND